ncbi:MAG: hypothetical protein ACE5R6_14785 [Candidatus Heimdallarchaeota archaeon]
MNLEALQKWLRALRIKKIAYSLLLILVILYPNLYLAGKQAITQLRGMDSLIDPEDPYVKALAEEALTNETVQSGELTIEEYIYSVIHFKRDIDLYLNMDYWASPAETIQRRAGDCEDRAIVVKSVEEYLGLGEDSKLVIQPRHVYIEREGIIYGGKSSIDSYFDAVVDFVKDIPLLRKVLILLGLIWIWGKKPQWMYL